jgi:uncharacterized alkaline shock family protein YloU
MTEYRSAGKTTLTPDVLLTIARMAALEVEGVKCMAPVKGGCSVAAMTGFALWLKIVTRL